MSLEPKKSVILRMLQIFGEYSDESHPLKQADIIDILKKQYDLDIERKAIGRNISLLKDAGVNIVSTRKGSYLEGQSFEKNEIRMLIDVVLASKFIDIENSQMLVAKLIEMGGQSFQNHFKHVYCVDYFEKKEQSFLFSNIEQIDDALNKNLKITFEYGIDNRFYKVSPFQMILDNQKYYLVCFDENLGEINYFRVDRLQNLKMVNENAILIQSVKGYENGLNFKKLSQEKPYLLGN